MCSISACSTFAGCRGRAALLCPKRRPLSAQAEEVGGELLGVQPQEVARLNPAGAPIFSLAAEGTASEASAASPESRQQASTARCEVVSDAVQACGYPDSAVEKRRIAPCEGWVCLLIVGSWARAPLRKARNVHFALGESSSFKCSSCPQLGGRAAGEAGLRLTRGCAQVFCGNAAKSIGVWEPPAGEMQERVVLNGHCGWVRALAVEGRWLFRRASRQIRLFGCLARCEVLQCHSFVCWHDLCFSSCNLSLGSGALRLVGGATVSVCFVCACCLRLHKVGWQVEVNVMRRIAQQWALTLC